MVKILYRLTEDIEYLKSLDAKLFDNESDLEGFFALNFDGNLYGYYHNNPLKENERGTELITNWFVSLLQAFLVFQKTKYVAVNDIESFNTWIEFKMEEDQILVSIVEAEKEDGSMEFRTVPFERFNYGRWKNIRLDVKEYHNQLVLSTSRYLTEISNINVLLLQSKRIKKLNSLIFEVKCLIGD